MNQPNTELLIVRVALACPPDPWSGCREYHFDTRLHTHEDNYVVRTNAQRSTPPEYESNLLSTLLQHLLGPTTGVVAVKCRPFSVHVHCSLAVPVVETNQLILDALHDAGREPKIMNELALCVLEQLTLRMDTHAMSPDAATRLREKIERELSLPESEPSFEESLEGLLRRSTPFGSPFGLDFGDSPFKQTGDSSRMV